MQQPTPNKFIKNLFSSVDSCVVLSVESWSVEILTAWRPLHRTKLLKHQWARTIATNKCRYVPWRSCRVCSSMFGVARNFLPSFLLTILVPTSNGKRNTTPYCRCQESWKKPISLQEDDAVFCKRIKSQLPYFVSSTAIYSAILGLEKRSLRL